MNSLQRLENVLSAQPVDRIPNFDIFMTRAAHHIGAKLSDYYLDYHVLCQANLAVLQDFELDIVQAISDPYREAADIGLEVEFPHDSLPISKKPLIGILDELKRVRFPVNSFGRRMTDRLDGVNLLRKAVGDAVPVMGWVEGALAEAGDLIGMHSLMIALAKQPSWLKDLLEMCVEVEIAFASAQIDAGAHIIGLGDAVASQVSPRMYAEFALPYEQRIFAAVKAKGGITRLHVCGNTRHLLPLILTSGAQIVDIDWMVDLRQAADTLSDLVVCGNLDPVAVFLQGTPDQVRQGVLNNAQAVGRRWISAAGCEIPDQTPVENLHAQSLALHELAGQSQ